MIAPIDSVMPNFRGIYQSKEYMQPAQAEVAERIKTMLTSPDYQDKKGRTLEQQAGIKADFFINQPAGPQSLSDNQRVRVSLAFTQHIDMWGNKFGYRGVHDIGSFTKDNVETFPDCFLKTNAKYNSDKTDNRMNAAAVIIGLIALFGVFAKDAVLKFVSLF